jgi:hypothetical protein
MMSVFGEFRIACLYSKVWSLREAAILKLQLMLQATDRQQQQGRKLVQKNVNKYVNECLPSFDEGVVGIICEVICMGLEDKIQQVFVAAIALLETLLLVATK